MTTWRIRPNEPMLDWLDVHPQDRFGVAPYSLDGSGVTRVDLEPVFEVFVFDIELEGGRPMKAAVTTAEHGFEIVDMPDLLPDDDQLLSGWNAVHAGPTSRPSLRAGGHGDGARTRRRDRPVGSRADGWREGINHSRRPSFRAGRVSTVGQARCRTARRRATSAWGLPVGSPSMLR